MIKKQNIKISLLHLDLDVYEPTILSLNLLYNKVSKGGIILIDDYSQVKGATKATDEFIKKRNKNLYVAKIDNGKLIYIGNKIRGNFVSAKSKSFGEFC